MTFPGRCRAPKTARLAGFGHMNGYNLETRSWVASDYSPTNHASHRLSYDLWRDLVQRPRATPIEATWVWSMSLTRFGVAKLRAAVRAMLKQYDGAEIQMATQCRITSLARSKRLLSVTVSVAAAGRRCDSYSMVIQRSAVTPQDRPSPTKKSQSALAYDLEAMAVVAHDEAREMPP